MQETVAVISLKQIRANAEAVLRAAQRPLIAVVKDDAYGHGAERVSLALEDKAAAFAVASVIEGAALKTAGVTKDVLVLTPCLDEEEAERAAAYGLIVPVTSLASLNRLKRAGALQRAHLAVNTGMNRYGVSVKQIGRICRAALEADIAVEGVYSHFYAPQDSVARTEQRHLFKEACEEVKTYFPDVLCHISATGGMLAGEESDAVRAGIALYGYLPQGFEGKLAVRPAMKLYAAVAHTAKQIGGGAGYQRIDLDGPLYTLRLGYGDGVFRAGFDGAVGNLCMDACVCSGDARFGRVKRVIKDVSAYARTHGTTEYEALVDLGKGAVKLYV